MALAQAFIEMKWFRSKSASPAAGKSPDLIAGEVAELLQKARAEMASREGESPALLVAARRELESGDQQAAFSKLNGLKAGRARVQGVDFLRAEYFLRAGEPHAAIEALKEELRYFPANEAAGRLREALASKFPEPAVSGDPEFLELLAAVQAYTMVGVPRLQSLYTLAKAVCAEDAPGNFVECGVAAGGSSALLAAVIARHSKRPRKLFSFDTFEGMPAADERDTHSGVQAAASGWGEGTCSASENSLWEAAKKLNAEHLIEPVKGLFADTLPTHRERIGPIALLHMDGDWYSSTRDILTNLFDQVADGGRIQIDDYGYWEGCKKAVTEFAEERGLKLEMTRIDSTGVWLPKPKGTGRDRVLVNLGCGGHFHPAWKNVDFAAQGGDVIEHDLRKRLPFPDGSCDAVYHSHVLEHFSKAQAPLFLQECFRILRPGGILRVATPNLEQIAKLYLENLTKAAEGNGEAAGRYEWMTIELMDQMTRERSGGEMLRHWLREPMPAQEFVVERLGREVLSIRDRLKQSGARLPDDDAPNAKEIGKFRESGEVHKWLYDRYSLKALLERCGFVEAKVVGARESRIAEFDSFHLDALENGETRKPDSIFMEARKPGGAR